MVMTLTTLGGPRRGLVETADTDDPSSVEHMRETFDNLIAEGYHGFASGGQPGTETKIKDFTQEYPLIEMVPQIAGG